MSYIILLSTLKNHPMKKNYTRLNTNLRLFVCLLFATIGITKSVDAQVNVNATVGTLTGSYTTLNAAFTAINAGTHKGIINISIVGNTIEPATPDPLLKSDGTTSIYTAITIKPSGGNFTINSAAAPVANRGIIELAGADNVTIDGDDPLTAGTQNLSIVSVTSTTAGIGCIRLSSNSTTGTDGADNIVIKNCIIKGARSSATVTTTSYGIQFSNGVSTSSSSTGAYSSINTSILNNNISRCYYAINAIGNSTSYLNTGLVIKNNIIGNATSADNIGFRGISLSYTASAAGATSAQITNNDIRVGDYGTSGYSTSIAGIEVSSANAGININANNIHDISQPATGGYGAHGILVSNSTSNASIKITNNFIRDCKMYIYQTSASSPFIPTGVYFTAAVTNVVFNHNTIVMNNQLATNATYSSFCVNASTSGVTFSQFLNNILVNNHASSNAFAFYTGATSVFPTTALINNNDYFVNIASKIGYYNGITCTTILDWQAATGKDNLSFSTLPPFISATDLHLTSASIGQFESGGANVATTGINTDIDGQTRPGTSSFGFGTAPDVGADEFDGKLGYSCATPTPGATISSSNNICFGNNVTLSLANAVIGTGISYQWQTSNDNVTYTDISGAITTTYSTTPTTNTYYRCKVVCLNGPAIAYSTPIQIVFANNILTTTAASRCGYGTVNLQATAMPGGTINWYNVATGGGSLGTGTTFTTPNLSTTTPFYVESNIISTGSVAVGAGATTSATYPNPFYSNWSNSHNQYIIRASELQAAGLSAGNITSLGIQITSGTTNILDFSLKMAHTTANDISAFVSPTFTNVYAAATVTPIVGLNTFTFTTPFNWDGVSNIVIEMCQGNSGTTATVSSTAVSDATSYISTIHTHITSSTAGSVICANTTTNVTTYSVRPRFTFGGQATCSSPRKLVTATVTPGPVFDITNNTTVCNNAITTLSVNSPAANYNQVNWSPITNLYSDATATTPYVAGQNLSTVYLKNNTAGLMTYTAIANNTTSNCGGKDTVVITTLPSNLVVTALQSNFCQTGSSTLNLTPTFTLGAGAINWENSLNNTTFTNIVGANGMSYTTPTINTTTYYRVKLKDASNNVCLNTNSDTVYVNNPLITSTTNGERCGPGTVNLAATANSGNIAWYAAATGGTQIATGNTFTTPSLTSTSTYYASNFYGSSSVASIGAGALTTQSDVIYSAASPFAYHFGNYKHQMLITAAELNAAGIQAGNITSLGFDVATVGSPIAAFNNFSITIIPTNITAATTAFLTGGTTVYPSTTVTPSIGVNTYNFTTPFAWDGVSNIVVQTCYSNNNSGVLASSAEVKYDVTPIMSHTVQRADGSTANICSQTTATNSSGDGPLLNKRPKMIFNSNSLCEGNRVPVVATIKVKPVANLTPNGIVNICPQEVKTLTTTAATGNTYTWFKENTIINNATNNTYNANTAGAYKVAVLNLSGCSDTSTTANIVIIPNPVVNLGSDTAICTNSILTLDAQNTGSGITYLWSNNSTTQTIDVTNPNTYSIVVTNSTGCKGRDTIVVTNNPLPIVNLGNDTMICNIVPLILNAGNVGSTYLWNTGSTSQTLSVNTAGPFSVTVTNIYGCVASDAINITLQPRPEVAGFNFIPNLNNNLGQVQFIPENPVYVSNYLWDFGDGVTSTIMNPIHQYNSNGNYNVRLTVSNSCTDSVVDLLIEVDLSTGIKIRKKDKIALNLYPNPTNDIVKLDIITEDAFINRFAVYNILGQQVLKVENLKNQTYQFDVQKFAPGTYTIIVETNKGSTNKRFQIIK